MNIFCWEKLKSTQETEKVHGRHIKLSAHHCCELDWLHVRHNVKQTNVKHCDSSLFLNFVELENNSVGSWHTTVILNDFSLGKFLSHGGQFDTGICRWH